MENIQTLLEKYGRTSRLVGDNRACLLALDFRTEQHKQAREALDFALARLARVENTLEDMGLLRSSDRHTDRGQAS